MVIIVIHEKISIYNKNKIDIIMQTQNICSINNYTNSR